MSEHGIVSVADVHALAVIVGAASEGSRVTWMLDGSDHAVSGVARAIAHEGGGFLTDHDDVRDGFLHVSGTVEVWLPITQLIDMLRNHTFVVQS